MFSKLLKSTARRRLFQILIDNRKQKYYLRQLAQLLNYSPGSLQRELSTLVTDGILANEQIGNMKFFFLNTKSPFVKELKQHLDLHTAESRSIKPQPKKIFSEPSPRKQAKLTPSISKKDHQDTPEEPLRLEIQ